MKSLLSFIAAASIALAACSTNAGFGTPASGPQPLGPGYPNAASPVPSGSIVPLESGAPISGSPGPESSASPLNTATPIPDTLTVEGASLHLAYDASVADPVKAPRLLELAFALQNTTHKTAKVADVKVSSDNTAVAEQAVSVTAPAGQTSQAAFATLKTSQDPTRYKQLNIDFIDDAKKPIGTQKLDVPQQDFAFTSLDEKHPKGGVSIDSVEISKVDSAGGPHYECTFALTNASATQAQISQFVIAPPKGPATKVSIPVVVPARSTSGFVSIVLAYNGKALPGGSYGITAMQNANTIAKGSANLL